MAKRMDHLKQLKDFDENITHEKQAKAREEQEKIKAKVIWILVLTFQCGSMITGRKIPIRFSKHVHVLTSFSKLFCVTWVSKLHLNLQEKVEKRKIFPDQPGRKEQHWHK